MPDLGSLGQDINDLAYLAAEHLFVPTKFPSAKKSGRQVVYTMKDDKGGLVRLNYAA
jgi:hypothetical protein